MAYKNIIAENRSRVGLITLNRPKNQGPDIRHKPTAPIFITGPCRLHHPEAHEVDQILSWMWSHDSVTPESRHVTPESRHHISAVPPQCTT